MINWFLLSLLHLNRVDDRGEHSKRLINQGQRAELKEFHRIFEIFIKILKMLALIQQLDARFQHEKSDAILDHIERFLLAFLKGTQFLIESNKERLIFESNESFLFLWMVDFQHNVHDSCVFAPELVNSITVSHSNLVKKHDETV